MPVLPACALWYLLGSAGGVSLAQGHCPGSGSSDVELDTPADDDQQLVAKRSRGSRSAQATPQPQQQQQDPLSPAQLSPLRLQIWQPEYVTAGLAAHLQQQQPFQKRLGAAEVPVQPASNTESSAMHAVLPAGHFEAATIEAPLLTRTAAQHEHQSQEQERQLAEGAAPSPAAAGHGVSAASPPTSVAALDTQQQLQQSRKLGCSSPWQQLHH